jgi:hypothetical protein
MLRKLMIAVTFVATIAVAGLVTTNSAEARGRWRGGAVVVGRPVVVARPVNNRYYYYNGPPQAFFGPTIGIHSNAYDIGPYGPGYGWPYRAPIGRRFYVTF